MGPGATPGTTAADAVTVNGRSLPLGGVTPHTTLLDWLRGRGLTGAKEGCAEGECGACAVLVLRPDPAGATVAQWTALNACLVPAAALDGQEVLTAEGLGSPRDLHPVQSELAGRGGSQCGYCTPGFVCAMAAEYYRSDRAADPVDGTHGADADDAVSPGERGPNGFDLHALSGNLCRCTGYRPIRDAAYALAAPADGDPLAARLERTAPAPRPTDLEADGARLVRPATLDVALRLVAARPDAVVAAGFTDVGVDVNLAGARPRLVVVVDRLEELRGLDVDDEGVRIGAALTLTELERGLGGRVPLLSALFPLFASRLIRNGATLGGNLGTGSPIGDAPPVLLALRASVVLASAGGERSVPLSDFWTGYRQTVLRPGELIREVRLPLPLAPLTAFHKVAKRRFDDISSVAVAHALDVVDGVVRAATIGVGGAAATPFRATAAEDALVGRPWDAASVRAAADVLGTAGTPMDDHRASARYRSAMLRQSLLRLYAENPRPSEVAS